MAGFERTSFEVPDWAGKPPNGLHLDVLKDGKMVQKLMIDERKCYFFGRNRDLCDFSIDHASCSRVHAVLVWHKDLNRSFLIDLGSTHGTFVGPVQLEAHKPQQLFTGTQFHFGASTRTYVIRERPQATSVSQDVDSKQLPGEEVELDNLTEFNTAHNRRIAQLITSSDPPAVAKSEAGERQGTKRPRKRVTFSEEEEIINPEDNDPTVGRFRNLVQTTLITTHQKKRPVPVPSERAKPPKPSPPVPHPSRQQLKTHFGIASKLGIPMPNLAPDLSQLEARTSAVTSLYSGLPSLTSDEKPNVDEPKPKKKYMKEAWPGKKPALYV